MKKIYVSDLTDERMKYSLDRLKQLGYEIVNNQYNADYIVQPPNQVGFDYSKSESFVLKNAYLTAEAAVGIAICESEKSLINSNVLIVGYGRIAKALHKYLSVFTSDITVCARNKTQQNSAKLNGANVVDFSMLKANKSFDFVFNTVPFPVINEAEIMTINKDVLMIDLASFPGGIDKHVSKAFGIKLIQAWGLPGKYSPITAGYYLAEAVDEIIKEGLI